MATIAEIEGKLVAIEDAIVEVVSGRVAEVRRGDRMVKYDRANLKDLLGLRSLYENDLANAKVALTGGRRRRAISLAVS